MRHHIVTPLGLIAFFLVLFTSCSKSNDLKKSPGSGSTITSQDSVALGYWFGSFDAGAYNQSYLLTSDLKVKVYDFYYYPTSTDTSIALDGYGYWSVSGNQLTIVDSFSNGEKFTSVNTLNSTGSPETFTDNTAGDVYSKQ
jgi:hypothetical protein